MTIRETIWRLRQDALERRMIELAITYGWSAIRLADEELAGTMAELRKATSR
jgi:hypothetical protein